MKNILFIFIFLLSANAYAGTYTLWHQSYEGAYWQRGTTFSDFGQCENARKWLNYYYATRCVAD